MSVDIYISPKTNDIAHKRGRALYVVDANEVLQRLRTRLRRHFGEWFAFVAAGIAYYENLLGKKNTGLLKLIIRREIMNTEGVDFIKSMRILYDNKDRAVSLYAEIRINGTFHDLNEEFV